MNQGSNLTSERRKDMSETVWQRVGRLQQEGDPAAIDTLTNILLNSREPAERAEAAMRLNAADDPRAADAMNAALHDSNRRVQTEAASALGRWEDPRALPELDRMSKRLFEDPEVKRVAAKAAKAIKEGLSED
jgi:HEAT repeat protein